MGLFQDRYIKNFTKQVKFKKKYPKYKYAKLIIGLK